MTDPASCPQRSGASAPAARQALWLFSPEWPDLLHPFASAIDSELPVPPSSVHIMLRFKPAWVQPATGDGDRCFDLYPEESVEDWHRSRSLWVE